MNALTRYLGPHAKTLKARAETELLKHKDLVLLGKAGATGGITDISFENRECNKKVSLYFSVDSEGLESYRKMASMFHDSSKVELKYTPHLGQSRITFEWGDFWKIVEERKLNQLEGDDGSNWTFERNTYLK
jgi:hypothetical protein